MLSLAQHHDSNVDAFTNSYAIHNQQICPVITQMCPVNAQITTRFTQPTARNPFDTNPQLSPHDTRTIHVDFRNIIDISLACSLHVLTR